MNGPITPSEEDDYAELPCYQLKYSIAMEKKILAPDHCPHLSDAHLEQLRKDAKTLCGKDDELVEEICESMDQYYIYEMEMVNSGQDIFISAAVVRKLKEDIDLVALESHMSELLKEGDPIASLEKKLAALRSTYV